MRWGDVFVPLWGPVLFVVGGMMLLILVAALECGLDEAKPLGEGPDVAWEWVRGPGTFRMTAPANVTVRFGIDATGMTPEGVWTVTKPTWVRFMGQLRCSLEARDGPCRDTPTIERVGGDTEKSVEENRAILLAIAASFEWEPQTGR